MFFKKKTAPGSSISDEDLNWTKETLARLLIENGVLRLVTGHLIAQKCKEAEDPLFALRDLHRALDAAAQLAIEKEHPPGMQRLVERYQPEIDKLIQLAGTLISARPQQP
jgi:sulfur transfer complex TusBCD TusB component (DsrH family)